jgi:hypothetical protein
MMGHFYEIEAKTVQVRSGAALVTDCGEALADTGHRYRYACSCGRTGRWFRDGNMAKMYAEAHVGTE